jgi:hypothetical protein
MIDRAELRALVRDVVCEAVSGLTPPAATPAPTVADQPGVTPTGPLAADDKTRTDTVRLASDSDLDGFVRALLRLFENPKTRADLRTGRLRFRLAGASAANHGSHRIESGAITERHIADIATSGSSLVLGRKAVLTPLAREKARALGVSIQKERK